jgi:HEAT repeat protein
MDIISLLPDIAVNVVFGKYLESITRHYAQWWTLYTLTDAVGQQERPQSSPFDFGLMVQSVEKQEKPLGEERQEEKRERLLVLKGLRKYAVNHVLLIGQPGSGKSTALARLMLEEAEQGGIPVLVELRYYRSSIADLIQSFFQRHGLTLTATEIESLLKDRRLMLLVDGVNELPSEEARQDLATFRRSHLTTPMIFATRDLGLGGNLGIEQSLKMQPLTEAQMRDFVRSRLGDQAEALLRQLKERLREFGQTPLLLWMLCELFQQVGQVPNQLGLVFREFTRGYERLRGDVQVAEESREQWSALLQRLAWGMMQSLDPAKPTEFRVAIDRGEVARIFTEFLQPYDPYPARLAKRCLKDLLKHHLIQVNGEQIEFRHQLIQEYYAAEYLLGRLRSLDEGVLQREYLNYLKWTEPLGLMLGLVEDPKEAERVVRSGLEVDLRLGARLVGEVKREFQEKSVNLLRSRIEELNISEFLKIKLLGETCSQFVAEELLRMFDNSTPGLRELLISTLYLVGNDAVVSKLLQVAQTDVASQIFSISVEGKEPYTVGKPFLFIRARAISTLGAIGSDKAIKSLRQLTNHPDIDARLRASYELGLRNCDIGISILDEAMRHSEFSIRKQAVELLSEIGNNKIIKLFLKVLEHEYSRSYESIVLALGQINTKASITKLIRLVNHSNCSIRRQAVELLGQMGCKAAVPTMIKALETSEAWLQGPVITSLGQIGDKMALSSLLNITKNDDHHLRQSAVKALGKIGEKAAIPRLLEMLKDDDRQVREEASEVLGVLGDERILPTLLSLLHDQNSKTRYLVARILGKVGSQKCVPGLIEILDDQDEETVLEAAIALMRLNHEKGILWLRQKLENVEY